MIVRGRGATRRSTMLAAAAGIALVLAACSSGGGKSGDGGGNGLSVPAGQPASGASTGRIAVVAGENFWGNIAAQIGGDAVTVSSFISDPNTDPHEYQSNVKDAAALAGAKLVIENGAGYDDFLPKLLAASPVSGRGVLNVASLVDATGNDVNPHLWYDPDYVRSAARAIEARLVALRSSASAVFSASLNRFLAGEQQVSDTIATIKARYAGTPIGYTERVPGYLVQAAGLKLATPASFARSIEDGTDPSPLDNATFERDLTGHKIKVLLYNAQVTDSETTHLRDLARHSGIAVVGVTETMPPSATSFQAWQNSQAQALLAALGG